MSGLAGRAFAIAAMRRLVDKHRLMAVIRREGSTGPDKANQTDTSFVRVIGSGVS